MAAIEAGAEDVETDEGDGDEDEGGHWIYCADTDLNEVSNALEAALGESRLDETGVAAADDHDAGPRRRAEDLEADREPRG